MRDDPTVVALVQRARDGDPAAWDQIVERYAALIWSTCRRFGLSGAQAEDVGGNVWLRLVERLDTLREPAALPGWLATTTQRICLQTLQDQRRHVPVAEAGIGDSEELPSDTWLLIEDRRLVLRHAFSELSARCQKLLTFLFRDPPAPYTEISSELEMPIGAIGPNRQRCLQRLRESRALGALLETSSSSAGTAP
jgi:RNA polymerase sigma factor (sigma-70 family)